MFQGCPDFSNPGIPFPPDDHLSCITKWRTERLEQRKLLNHSRIFREKFRIVTLRDVTAVSHNSLKPRYIRIVSGSIGG
eukprot:298580-Amorphochlora_amoeboformis.AAC.1